MIYSIQQLSDKTNQSSNQPIRHSWKKKKKTPWGLRNDGVVEHEAHLLPQICQESIYTWKHLHKKFPESWQKNSGFWQSKKIFMKPVSTKENEKGKQHGTCTSRRQMNPGKSPHQQGHHLGQRNLKYRRRTQQSCEAVEHFSTKGQCRLCSPVF